MISHVTDRLQNDHIPVPRVANAHATLDRDWIIEEANRLATLIIIALETRSGFDEDVWSRLTSFVSRPNNRQILLSILEEGGYRKLCGLDMVNILFEPANR